MYVCACVQTKGLCPNLGHVSELKACYPNIFGMEKIKKNAMIIGNAQWGVRN